MARKIKVLTLVFAFLAGAAQAGIIDVDELLLEAAGVHSDVGISGVGFCGCDFVREGRIDFADLAEFAKYWGRDDCWSTNNWCDGRDIYISTRVDYRDLKYIADCWLDEDLSPPTPSPMKWDASLDANGFDGKPREVYIGPNPTFDWGATMRADPNTFDDTGFEFYFECLDDGRYSSGWLKFPQGPPYIYTRKLGNQNLQWRFRVKARDLSINKTINVTGWSSVEIAD